MKNQSFLLLFFLLSGLFCSAQDTIAPPVFYQNDNCGLTVWQYRFDGPGGFITGNNHKGDKEKAQKFPNRQNDLITAVLVWFPDKMVGANPGNLSARIYSVHPATGKPDMVLGQSAPINLADVPVSNDVQNCGSFPPLKCSQMAGFVFNPPVQTGNGYFVAFDLTGLNSGDTIGCFASSHNCFVGEPHSWEKTQNDNWAPMADNWTTTIGGTEPLKIDLNIYPVRVIGVSASSPANPDLQVWYQAANHSLFLKRSNMLNEQTTVTVFDLGGRPVVPSFGMKVASEISVFPLPSLMSGIYLVQYQGVDFSGFKRIFVP